MSTRDAFYADIVQALGGALDTDAFERLAAELVQSKGYATNLAVGGADNGYDFELLDSSREPGPGVVTTSDRVTGNLKRNLERNSQNCPGAARKTYVVTSSALTSAKRDNLKKAATERGYVYLGASDRHEVARYIYANPHWARELLGLSGDPSALSVVPRTSRPLLELPIIGREGALQLLRELQRDALIIGSPGSGKTAMLARLAADGLGSFLVSQDMTAVANAIRQQGPGMVIVDDLEDTVAAARDLARLRNDIGAEFRIVVTDWERNPVLEDALGLEDRDVIALERLTRDEIVEVVGSVGIAGPRQLVREIVDQAEGVPGLAVALTQAALAGEYQALFDGDRLGIRMESTVNRLLGNSNGGDKAVLALAAISLSGDSGLTLEDTADFVDISKSELYAMLRRLDSGGIIRSDARRVSLRPRTLRRYLIRKAFFSSGALADYSPLLSVVQNTGQALTELVLASRSGAVVPGLLELVLESKDPMAARYYVGSGERQAREYLRAAPDMSLQVAGEALHSAPDAVIPSLLALAVDDRRELHNTPEQPLRLIKDWANSAVPGRGEVIQRKRAVVTAAVRWAADGNDLATACRACTEVLRTSFEGTEADPGAGMTIHIVSGMLTDEEVEQLRPLWGQLKGMVEQAQSIPWPSLLSLCSSLVRPSVFGDRTPDAFEASHRLGQTVIEDLGHLAIGHPGALERLNYLRANLGIAERYDIPDDYEVLLGERDFADWDRDEEDRRLRIVEFADHWATQPPGAFAARLKFLQDESALVGRVGYDRSPVLCREVAQRVDDSGAWLAAMTAAGVTPDCLLPFLDRAVKDSTDEWESIILSMLDDQSLEYAGIDAALRAPRMSEELWTVLSPMLSRHTRLIDILCLRDQVSSVTLCRLLEHESADVAHAAAVGMWTGRNHGVIPPDIRGAWEDAVIRIDDDEYWLEEILASSPAMAARWLRSRIANQDWRALWRSKNVDSACRGLDSAERLEILRSLSGNLSGDLVVAALIGDSEELYRELLRDTSMGDFWEAPLRRNPDDLWRCRAGIALEEGKSPREVASASSLRTDSWSGPYSAHLQAKIDAYTPWLDDEDSAVRATAAQKIDWLIEAKTQALADERRQAVEGFR